MLVLGFLKSLPEAGFSDEICLAIIATLPLSVGAMNSVEFSTEFLQHDPVPYPTMIQVLIESCPG
jgi:hypothetical protein